jgi:hypothetical protein
MRVRRWARLLVWPAVAAIYGAGASPAVAQSLPRFLLPGLAAVGAVVILWSSPRWPASDAAFAPIGCRRSC